MPISHRKSTSPRRTSRHNPVQPIADSLQRPWYANNVSQGDPAASTAFFIVTPINVPSYGVPAVDLNTDYRDNPQGSGVYVLTADGEKHIPVDVGIGGAGSQLDVYFDLTGYAGQDVTFIVEPNQNRLVIGNGGRLAGAALSAGII